MGRKPREMPAEVVAVGERIEEWRATRTKRTRMPEELWWAATEVARLHGVWFVSRSVGVNYERLRERVESVEEHVDDTGGFVELDTSARFGTGESAEAVVELSRPDGASVKLRIPGVMGFDVIGLARVFLQQNEA